MHFFELRTIEFSEVDLSNAVAVFQCADDVVFIRNVETKRCMDAKRERWPEFQRRLHVCFGFAPEAQVEIDADSGMRRRGVASAR